MSTDQTTAPFAMPRPYRGQAVIYYPNGIVGEHHGTVGYVTLVGRTSIELLAHGMLKETVCHKDDPVVKDNIHVRKSGVWDFSGRDIEVNDRIAALEAKLAALEAAGTKPSK
jgi:hypothetical protein